MNVKKTIHPDKFYGGGHESYTIISMPSKNLLFSQSFPTTHEEMLQLDVSQEDMETLYNQDLSHDYAFRERPEEDEEFNHSDSSKPYDSSGVKQSIFDRYYFQTHADGYLGRAKIIGNDLDFSLWPSKSKSMYAPEKIKQIAKQLAEYFDVENLKFYVPKEVFDVTSPRHFLQQIVNFKYDPDKKTIKKTVPPKEPTPEPIANPEHNIKKYDINGEMYSLNDLVNRRKELHLKGAKNIDEVLCAIDEKKYPELKGYKPMNCPKEELPKPKLNPWTVKRSPEDWKGIPINRLTSENLSFINYVNRRDRGL